MSGLGEVIAASQAGTQAGAMEGEAINKGVNQGFQYAQQQSQLDIQRQQVQNQQQYLDTYKKEFQFKIGSQKMDDLLGLSSMDEGPTKKKVMDQIREHYESAGSPISESVLASTSDESFKDSYKKLGENFAKANKLTGDQLEGYKSLIAQVGQMPGSYKMKMDAIEKINGQMEGFFGKEAAAQAMASYRAPMLGIQQDKLSAAAADSVHKAPNMKSLTGQMETLGDALRLLHKPDATITELNDAMSQISRAISRQSVVSDSQRKELGVPTLQADIEKWAGYNMSDPNQPAPENSKKLAIKIGGRVFDTYEQGIKREATRSAQGKNYKNNPDAQRSLEEARDYYAKGEYGSKMRKDYGLPENQIQVEQDQESGKGKSLAPKPLDGPTRAKISGSLQEVNKMNLKPKDKAKALLLIKQKYKEYDLSGVGF